MTAEVGKTEKSLIAYFNMMGPFESSGPVIYAKGSKELNALFALLGDTAKKEILTSYVNASGVYYISNYNIKVSIIKTSVSEYLISFTKGPDGCLGFGL